VGDKCTIVGEWVKVDRPGQASLLVREEEPRGLRCSAAVWEARFTGQGKGTIE
jgi:hypothetical protein